MFSKLEEIFFSLIVKFRLLAWFLMMQKKEPETFELDERMKEITEFRLEEIKKLLDS